MTNAQIRRLSAKRLYENTDIIASCTLYYLSTAVLVLLLEGFITFAINIFSDEKYTVLNFLSYYDRPVRLFLLAVRCVIYYIMLSLARSVQIRYLINMNGSGDSDRFIRMHWSRILIPSLKGSLCLLIYKLMTASPLALSIYGIIHFRIKSYSVSLTLSDLVCFMLCIGFSLVWLGALVHYYTSLSLVKYIFAINPRANFFNACDLSVKLMEGTHMRITAFWIRMIPYMLPAVLLYPLTVIYPFVMESRLLLAKEIMGSYWQDKIPAMARRWERQQERLNRP